MVDEVEIRNVGGDGNVASEETLARLVKSIEEFAKKSGMNPASETAKAQAAYSRTLKEDIKSIEEKIEAQEEYTGALRTSARALSAFGSGLLGLVSSGFGAVAGSLTNFAETVMGNDESLSGLVSNFPVFGSLLAQATQPLDDTIESFQTLSKIGATFGYDLSELRISARESRMALDEYTQFVERSSQQLAAFGGTVTGGSRAVSGFVDGLSDDVEQGLLRLGFTFEDINDQVANFLYLNRSNQRFRQQTEAEQALALQEYTKNLLVLNKLTGEDIQSIQDRIAAEQRDFAFQRAMSRMTADQQANINLLFQNVAATMGPEMLEIFKAQIINDGVIPPDLAAQFAVFRGSIGEMGAAIDQAMATPAELYGQAQLTESLTRMITSQLQDAEAMGSLLDVGAIVGEGVPAAILRTINGMQIDPSQLLRDGIVDPVAVRNIVEQAIMESADPGPEGPMGAFAAFQSALGQARLVIEENLITPFLDGALVPALSSFTSWLQTFTAEDGEPSKFENAIVFMREKVEAVFGRIQTFIDDFAADPEQAIADVVSDIGNFFRDAIFGEMINVGGDDPSEVRMERQGGLVQVLRDAISALFADDGVLQSLTNGIGTVTDGLVTGFRDFWNDPATATLRTDIRNLFEDIFDEMLNIILGRSSGVEGALENLTGQGLLDFREIGFRDNARRMLGDDLYERLTEGMRPFLDIYTGTTANIALDRLLEKQRTEGLNENELGILREVMTALGETPNFNEGTGGFRDFGKGTLAMLHGREAVIPLDSPLGRLIDELGSTQATGGTNLETMISNLTNALQGNTTNQVSSLETMISNLTNALQGNTANQVSSEALQELNTTMQHVLAELRQTRIIEERIERNTSSMGGNIANGRVSYIR